MCFISDRLKLKCGQHNNNIEKYVRYINVNFFLFQIFKLLKKIKKLTLLKIEEFIRITKNC